MSLPNNILLAIVGSVILLIVIFRIRLVEKRKKIISDTAREQVFRNNKLMRGFLAANVEERKDLFQWLSHYFRLDLDTTKAPKFDIRDIMYEEMLQYYPSTKILVFDNEDKTVRYILHPYMSADSDNNVEIVLGSVNVVTEEYVVKLLRDFRCLLKRKVCNYVYNQETLKSYGQSILTADPTCYEPLLKSGDLEIDCLGSLNDNLFYLRDGYGGVGVGSVSINYDDHLGEEHTLSIYVIDDPIKTELVLRSLKDGTCNPLVAYNFLRYKEHTLQHGLRCTLNDSLPNAAKELIALKYIIRSWWRI